MIMEAKEAGNLLALVGLSGPDPATHGGTLLNVSPVTQAKPMPRQPLERVGDTRATAGPRPYAPPKGVRKHHGGLPLPPQGLNAANDIEAGDYHIAGTQVQLRDAPSGAGGVKGVFQDGENIYLFGDIVSDPAYMIGAANSVVLNDGNHPGIDFARAGSQNFGPGWVAVRFTAPGAGSQKATPTPTPVVEPKPLEPKPAPVVVASSTTTYAPWIVGTALVALGVGAAYLLIKHRPQSMRTRTA